jgi:hypothetical protein
MYSKNQNYEDNNLRISNIGALLFAICSCLTFFNPLGLNNEVYPYFLIGIFFFRISLTALLAVFLILFAGVLWLIFDNSSRSLLDSIILASMVIGMGIFDSLCEYNKMIVVKIFKRFIIFSFIICVMQTIFSPIQDLTYSLFSGRNADLGSMARIGRGVTGLAPEPSYAAAHLVGLSFLVSNYVKPKFYEILIFILLLVLLRSVSGFLYGIIFIGFITFCHFKMSFKNMLIFTISLSIFFMVYFNNYDLTEVLSIFSRLINFLTLIIEYKDILAAEETFGSARLVAIIGSFSQIFFTDYGTAFSPLSVINILFASSLTSLFLIVFLLRINGISLAYLSALIMCLISGPIMLWPLFYVGFFGLNQKKDLFLNYNSK